MIFIITLSVMTIFTFPLFSENMSVEQICDQVAEMGRFDESAFHAAIEEFTPQSRDIFKAHDLLLRTYIERYLLPGADRIPEIESILLDFFDDRVWRNLLIYTAERGIFNEFMDERLESLDSRIGSFLPEFREQTQFAILLNRALNEYHAVEDKDDVNWQTVYDNLREAQTISSLNNLEDLYLEACKQLNKNREYFDLKAYRYFNQEDPDFWHYVRLYFDFRAIKNEKDSFGKEIDAIKRKLKQDVLDYIPDFPPERLRPFDYISAYEETAPLDPNNPESVIYEKKSIIVFFNTDCSFCGKELEFLSKNIKRIRKADAEVVAINTMYRHSLAVFDQVEAFRLVRKIEFPTYIDLDGNQSLREYGISAVPFMLLVDESGRIVQVVRLKEDGHLKMKLGWFINDFLDITL